MPPSVRARPPPDPHVYHAQLIIPQIHNNYVLRSHPKDFHISDLKENESESALTVKMLSENSWKVLLFVSACVVATEQTRALSLVYRKPYKNVMFVPKSYRSRQSRVLFLDEDESRQPYGRGEIDLTVNKNTKIKFDDTTDYEFTSPDDESTTKIDLPSGNERFYEPLPRFPIRQFQTYPSYYNGRFGRPYAPNFGFDFQPSFAPAVRTSLYNGYNGWKARSPRVVFPYAADSVNSVNALHTNSHAGPGFDNVVFREQNFGQTDVVDDQNLQDLNTANDAFAERGEWLLERRELLSLSLRASQMLSLSKCFFFIFI